MLKQKHIKRIPLYVIVGVVVLYLIVWGVSLIKCEVLTNKYYDEFENAYQSNSMISNVEYFKVLNCDGDTAEVYYISNVSGGVLEFQKQDGLWIETNWEVVWSTKGSASGAVWPYIWQVFITGL